MKNTRAGYSAESPRKMRPALNPEARENQLISLAFNLVEQRLLDGTATSQETTFFLKLGSTQARIEKETLINQNKLLEAKTEALQSGKKTEELYANALAAMKKYSGSRSTIDDD